MQQDGKIFFLSGIVSIAIYIALIFSVLLCLNNSQNRAKKYTDTKKNFIEISISENKKIKKYISKKKNITYKKKIIKKHIVKKHIVKKAEIKKSIHKTNNLLSSLFKNINTAKYIKKVKDKNITKDIKINQNNRISQKRISLNQENKKSAAKIIKTLSLNNIDTNINKNTGEYNKYIGKIQDILDDKWQETPGTIAGNSATVTVKIDKFGNFSYKIDTLSYNNEFNAKLQNFLVSMQNEKFPAYKNGNYIEIKVNFKDE